MGATSLSQMATSLAQSYGLPIGRAELVDPSGNLTVTPDQIVAQSGGKETLGSAAAKLNYISSAIANEQNAQQAKKAEAALSAGAGLVRSRGRGSAALMQSGYYSQLASLYDAQEFDAADYSYFIMKEQMDFQREQMARAEKLAKKKGMFGGIGSLLGAGVGALLGGPVGAGIGMQAGGALGGGAGGGGWL